MRSRPHSQRMLTKSCIPFLEGAGFALPLFVAPLSSRDLFVQEIDEYTNLISSFSMLASDQASAIPLPSFETKRGERPVFAFVDETGAAIAGHLDNIAPMLRSFLIRQPEQDTICLQIMELIGSKEERRDARLRMRNAIYRKSGAVAARAFYEKSSLRAVFWDQLIKGAASEEAAKRILALRAKLNVEITKQGKLIVDLEALQEKDRALINLEQIQSDLSEEFDLSDLSGPPGVVDSADLIANQDFIDPEVKAALQELRISSRQERRLAIIFDTALKNAKFGRELLDQYPNDSAMFTGKVIARLRSALSEGGWTFSDPHVEDRIYYEIHRTLVDSYGLTKGVLLLEFATRLGKYERVHKMIDQKLERTYSRYVEEYREQIAKALRKAQTQRVPPPLPLFER